MRLDKNSNEKKMTEKIRKSIQKNKLFCNHIIILSNYLEYNITSSALPFVSSFKNRNGNLLNDQKNYGFFWSILAQLRTSDKYGFLEGQF